MPLKWSLLKDCQWFYFAQVFYKVVIGLNKVSMICLYLRIFIAKYFRRLCYASLAVVISWAIGSVVATIFQCVPVAAFWDKSIKDPRCINSDVFWISYGITNIITDAIIFTLPMREVSRLHLPRREKIGIMLVFLTGALWVTRDAVRRRFKLTGILQRVYHQHHSCDRCGQLNQEQE